MVPEPVSSQWFSLTSFTLSDCQGTQYGCWDPDEDRVSSCYFLLGDPVDERPGYRDHLVRRYGRHWQEGGNWSRTTQPYGHLERIGEHKWEVEWWWWQLDTYPLQISVIGEAENDWQDEEDTKEDVGEGETENENIAGRMSDSSKQNEGDHNHLEQNVRNSNRWHPNINVHK